MKYKILFAGLASLALSAASHAGVKYIGTPSGTASSIVDLAALTVDGVVYTEAAFEAAFGGDYTDAASALNNVPTWQLSSADQYVLEDIVSITNGNLIIDAGVVVRGQPRSGSGIFDAGALLIASGAKIIAGGEASNPIVFTTASTTGATDGGRASGGSPVFWDQPGVLTPKSAETAGLWGGVIILGKAPTNADRDAGISGSKPGTSAVGTANKATREQVIFGYGSGVSKNTFSGTYTDGTTYADLTTTAITDDRSSIEGIPASASIALAGLDRFGGFESDDNSGILQFASIRHGGSNLAAASEVNGLTLGAVGRGTKISYVEIYGNTDDGIELFGGTVNLDHVVVIAQQDDGLDIDVGYSGTIQFALVVGGALGDKLLEWDGDYELETVNGFAVSSPATVNGLPGGNFSVYNATLLGNTVSGNHGVNIRSQAAVRLVNSLLVNPRSSVIDVDHTTGVSLNRQATNKFAQGISKFVGVSAFKTGLNDVTAWVAGGGDDATVQTALGTVAFANKFNSSSDSNPGLAVLPTTALTGGQLIRVVPDAGAASAGALDSVFDDGTFSSNASIVSALPFRGAFQPGTPELWTSGWTAAAQAGIIQP